MGIRDLLYGGALQIYLENFHAIRLNPHIAPPTIIEVAVAVFWGIIKGRLKTII